MAEIEKTHLEIQLSKAQKALFEYAASLAGFDSVSEFVVQAAQFRAQELVEVHKRSIVSEQDRAIFFDALMNPAEPSQALRDAFCSFQKALKR